MASDEVEFRFASADQCATFTCCGQDIELHVGDVHVADDEGDCPVCGATYVAHPETMICLYRDGHLVGMERYR